MTCAHCAAVAREVASLRDEVENWRAWGRPTPVEIEAERIAIWRRALRLDNGPARVLVRLIDGRGRTVRFETLVARPDGESVDVCNLAKVYISRLRVGLRLAGSDLQIIAVRGHGYMVDRESAARLLALIEGGGDA